MELLSRPEDRFYLLHKLRDALAERQRPGCGNEPPSGSD
jgi:hypothetical protein